MTFGDSYNCACPHCGKNLHSVLIGRKAPELHKIAMFTSACRHCGKAVEFWCQWEIAVRAEKAVDTHEDCG